MSTRIHAIFFLLLSAAVFAGAASVPKHVISVELYRNAVWVQVNVNESKPLSFILDSAAGRCVVARDTAEKLGLHIVELGEMYASTSESKVRIGASPDVVFGIGNAKVTTHASIVPFEIPSSAWGKRFEGALGYELFSEYVVDVDFDASRISLYDPATYEYQGKGVALPIRVASKIPMVRARVGLPGIEAVEGEFGVDTGGTTSIVFNAPFVRQHNLIAAARKMVPQLIDSPHVGVGGTGRRLLGRVQFVELGPFRIDTPIAGFAEAESGSLARSDVAGYLGCNLLHRFRLIFDYKRARLIIEPNSAFSAPPDEYDMSGMGLLSRGDDYSEIYVNSVTPDSPAGRAGIQPGDVIVAVDDKPIKGLLLHDVTRLFTQAGIERKVRVERGGANSEIRFVLRKVL